VTSLYVTSLPRGPDTNSQKLVPYRKAAKIAKSRAFQRWQKVEHLKKGKDSKKSSISDTQKAKSRAFWILREQKVEHFRYKDF
jgi:hypothetical protein